MKLQTLPVKRRPVHQGMFRRLSAVTKNRRQRVAAAATAGAGDMDEEDGSSKISRALTIIFLIHILAIGLIFVHQRFLDGRPVDTGNAAAGSNDEAQVENEIPAVAPREDLPRLSSGEKPYIVRAGDNYSRIAAAEGVEEADLRQLNRDVDIGPGLILKIPPKRIVAVEPKEVSEIRQKNRATDDRGLVEAVPVDVRNAPKARPADRATVVAEAPPAGGSYVVQPGDSVYRIATRYKVSQEALMRANQITDPRKMRAGMKLKIPQS